ncbi:conserved hypothetical protein [Burkholderia sp. H160]|nr:conserved hypothetical protein [Burkholderia sp. H160]
MKKVISAVAISSVALLLSACETTNSAVPYEASTDNVIAIQQGLKTTKVSVAPVILGTDVSEHLMCRLNGDVTVGSGKTLSQFVKDALQKELFTAQTYDPHGPAIRARIDKLSFSSVSPANWQITMHVESDNSPGYSVEENYQFETSWTAAGACKNVADAFSPAVQDLIGKVVGNPKFPQLAGK